tara:strand:- start:592 stop:930 length:339 start_codon:yes stop_codon:yes gene_type:complete
MAATTKYNDSGGTFSKPGLRITSAPIKPAQTPSIRLIPIRSPRIGIEKTVTKIGVIKNIECAVAKSTALIPEKKKNAVAIIIKERIHCNFRLDVFDKCKSFEGPKNISSASA